MAAHSSPSAPHKANQNHGDPTGASLSPFAKRAMSLSAFIDGINKRIGEWVMWLVLVTVLISCVNALSRKLLNLSSNAFYELQWYGFAAIFMLGAGYTLMKQAHVRVDVLLLRFHRRTQVKVEIFGLIFFLFPMAALVIYLSFPTLINKIVTGEMSSNAGGLIRWPVYALMPAGFVLLAVQGVSELIKRIGFLHGICADPGHHTGMTEEEELAAELRKQERID